MKIKLEINKGFFLISSLIVSNCLKKESFDISLIIPLSKFLFPFSILYSLALYFELKLSYSFSKSSCTNPLNSYILTSTQQEVVNNVHQMQPISDEVIEEFTTFFNLDKWFKLEMKNLQTVYQYRREVTNE